MCESFAAKMSSSFEKNPENGGTPASAAAPIAKVQKVTFISFRRPPISLMLFVCAAWITDPAPRNSSALKNAWVNRWNMAAG